MEDSSLKRKSNNLIYSNSKKLLDQKKIDKDFFNKLSFLTLEDLISLKLESASLGLNGKLYNFPILKFISDISKEAVVKYALTYSRSKKEASMILGTSISELNRLIKLYSIEIL